jgi:hypothetical protein
MKKNQLKEIIKAKLLEMGVTGGTAAGTAGSGPQYGTPYFTSKKKIKGVKDTMYASLGFKDADPDTLAKKQKGVDYVHLWKKSKLNEENFDANSFVDNLDTDDPEVKQRISKQMSEFEDIELKLNILIPLLQRAKQTTVNSYKKNPLIRPVYGSTELAVDYLNDLIKLFKNQQ